TASRSDGGEPDAHRDAFPRPCADPGTPAAGPPRRAPCIATRRNLPQERAPRPVPHESASSPGPVPGRPRRSTMHTMKRWNIEILLSEETDGDTANTWADAGLHAEGGTDLHGRGMARKHPADPEAPEIGEELAVSRALADLARQLRQVAAEDISGNTGTPWRP